VQVPVAVLVYEVAVMRGSCVQRSQLWFQFGEAEWYEIPGHFLQ